jgi:hypothetical protein
MVKLLIKQKLALAFREIGGTLPFSKFFEGD